MKSRLDGTLALVLLRRAAENEARRGVALARDGLDAATHERDRAEALLDGARRRAEAATRDARDDKPVAAGRRALFESLARAVAADLRAAEKARDKAERNRRDAEVAVEKARLALETALRAREAAEADADKRKRIESRSRNRREQRATDDTSATRPYRR